MKKIYLMLAAVAALTLFSCSKENDIQKEEVVVPAEEVTTPADDADVPEGMVRLTFAVSAENDAAPELKTSWDGSNHSWANGDQVRILWGTGDSDYVDAEVKSGGVSAVVPETAETFYAVYPTTATYALDLTEGKVTITIPRYQSGKFEDANIMVAKTSNTALRLDFKNMTSIIKLTTGNKYEYNTITVGANQFSTTKLAGTVSTTFPDTFAVDATQNTDFLTIQPGNPSGNTGVAAGKTYYLAMLPGDEITGGIAFKLETRSNSTVLVAGGISKSAFARERSKVYDLGTLDDRIVADWYISETGTEVGISESAPAGPARLMDLLNPSYSTNNTTAGWRLTNATIHVAGGTYNLQALNGGEVFDPNYNLSNLKVHIKGEGDTTNPTKFICNQTATTDRIFAISGTNEVGDFTFENITFLANGDALAPGTAFDFNSSKASKILFKNCVFTGFVQNSTINGGPVFVQNTGAATITFTDCSFSNNTCNTGGAVYIYNDNAAITFNNCVFDTNKAINYAGAIRARSFASLTINGGSFNHNSSDNKGGAIYLDAGSLNIEGTSFTQNSSTNNRGGAILFASTGGESTVSGVTFNQNSATNGGAIHTEAGKVTIKDNTVFSGNSATNGGAIRSTGAVTLKIENATFTGNTATNGGGIALEYDAGAETTITNSSFNTNGNSAILNKGMLKVVACSFKNNTTSSYGSAIYSVGANGKIATAKIFNSLFEGNESTPTEGSGSSMKGCTVLTGSYSYALVANSTFSGNIEHSKSHGVISPGTNTSTKVYVVSSTLSENLYSDGSSTSVGPDFARTTAYLLVYNTISTNTLATIANVVVQNSIFTLRRFKEDRNSYETMTAFGLNPYSGGVYPLNATYADDYNQGMDVDALKGLTYDGNITLTEDEKALLAEDQKGKPRTGGTIMGAYVLTTAPTE